MNRKSQIIAIFILAAVLVGLLVVAAKLKPRSENSLQTTASTYETTMQTTATPTTEETTQPTTAEPTQSHVPEITPDIVGLYIPAEDGTKARVLVTEFSAMRKKKTDIDCFEVIASQSDRLEGSSFSGIWRSAWDSFEGSQSAKIGFKVSFTLVGGEIIEKTILKPSDTKDFYDYLEIYLYDDIHQTPGVWYTHLEDKDVDDETVVSSIKLTSGSLIDQVGDIVLTAFVYNGEECFQDGEYIGQAAYTITITE